MFNLAVEKEIRVRTFHPDDAEVLFNLLEKNRSHLRAWIDPSALPGTAEAARIFTIECFFNSFADRMDTLDSPYLQEANGYFPTPHPPMELGIWVRDKLVGALTLSRLKDSYPAAEFGYWIAMEQAGKGIITRSVSALMDYAIDNMEIQRFIIGCARGNQRSRAVAERLGYDIYATIPDGEIVGELIYDRVIYGIQSTAWRERRKILSGHV